MDALRTNWMREAAGYLAHDLKESVVCLVRAGGSFHDVIDQDISDRLGGDVMPLRSCSWKHGESKSPTSPSREGTST